MPVTVLERVALPGQVGPVDQPAGKVGQSIDTGIDQSHVHPGARNPVGDEVVCAGDLREHGCGAPRRGRHRRRRAGQDNLAVGRDFDRRVVGERSQLAGRHVGSDGVRRVERAVDLAADGRDASGRSACGGGADDDLDGRLAAGGGRPGLAGDRGGGDEGGGDRSDRAASPTPAPGMVALAGGPFVSPIRHGVSSVRLSDLYAESAFLPIGAPRRVIDSSTGLFDLPVTGPKSA